MRKVSIELSQKRVSATVFLSFLGTAMAFAQAAPATDPVTASGAIQLPSGPPPTGLQRPVPAPKLAPPTVANTLQVSITAEQITALVKDRTLTIDDAVGIALAANRDYATSVAALQRARGMKNVVKASLVPQAGLGANITEYDQNTVINFVGQSILQINQFNPVYTAQVTLPIDLLGSIHAAVSQAQFNEVAARIDVNRARNGLVFAVRSAFFQALRAQGAYSVAVESLHNNQTRLEDAKKSVNAGLASRFDVITVQRDVADAQQSVVNARAQVTLALAQLKNVVGIDISVPIQIADSGAVEAPPGIRPITIAPPSSSSDSKAAPVIDSSLSSAKDDTLPDTHTAKDLNILGAEYLTVVEEALRTRPEILESDAQISAAKKGVEYARQSRLPSFGLQLQYVYQPDATVFVRSHEALATLSVNVPIFDGGLAAARIQEAKGVVSSAQTARRNAIDQVTLDVQQSYVAILQARDRVQVTEAEVAQAKEAYRLSRVRYTAGVSQTPSVSPQLELSNAEVALTVAETNRLNALYDYNVARCQLDRAVGRYSYGVGAGFASIPTAKATGSSR
jgi:outer membrane protein TolC